MNRRDLISLAALASGISSVSPVWAQFNLGKALEAGQDLAKAESITDEELKKYFDQVSTQMDGQSSVAPASNGLYAVSCGTQHRQWLHPCGQRVPMIGG